MKNLWVVTKNELFRYFVSPLAYVYLLSFLLLNASFAVYFGDFFNRGQADLQSMFAFLPWLFLLFLPGISMRLWSEEFRSKTVVQLVTMPVRISTLVWGKFFASWLFCGIGILLTFPFWLTVNVLGTPDNQVIVFGYGAALLLAGCMLAISQTMSALTKNQVIALVLAVIANLFFFWSGIEYILSFFRLFAPDSIIDVIASFSFLSHFGTVSRGLIEARDVIFFISMIFFFNYTTVLIVNFKTSGYAAYFKTTSVSYTVCVWLALLCGFFSVNIIANNVMRNWQYDATQEHLYTLTDSTKNILQNLPEPIIVKLYFSPILEQRNPNLRTAFDNIRILLKKYKNAAGKKFDYKIYYPQFLSAEEDIALADGLQAVPLIDLNQNALFGLTIEDSLKNKSVIPFFSQDNLGSLEQILSEKIYEMHHRKKTVGVYGSLPLFGSAENDGTYLRQPWQFMSVLQNTYETIQLKSAEDFAQNFDVLLLAAPKQIPEEIVQKIKEYSQAGGKIVLLFDPANEASRLYSFSNQKLAPSNVGELASFWGVQFYPDYVVADLKNSITVDASTNYRLNPVFAQDVIQFKLTSEEMNPFHPISKNLHQIMMASAGVVMPQAEALQNKTIKFTPLLKAGDISSLMSAKVVIDGLNPQKILAYFEPDDNQKIIAAEVVGTKSTNPFHLVVIADSDFAYDSFWSEQRRFLDSEYISHTFDNAYFLLNVFDYLTNDTSLLSLRGKRLKDRKFTGIETLRRQNSLQYKKHEEKIFAEMDRAQQALKEVWGKKDFENRENFTADELAAISKVRNHLNDLRQQLSDLRLHAYRDIRKISDRVTLLNIAAVPFVLILLIGLYKMCKRRRTLMTFSSFKTDAGFWRLLGIIFCLFILALFSVYLSNRSAVDSYEGKPAFPKVAEQINQINRIVLQSHAQTLTFYRENNEWKLAEFPDLPVYQERIRRFLNTTAEATFYMRKSDRAENLSVFDLAPLEDQYSKVIKVEFFDHDRLIQDFYLGDINLDLGRGSRAAYIRFENQFQVWEIRADYVNMSLDPQAWTYGHLWDLRYGRLYAPNVTEKEAQRYMILMKELLNTPIIAVSDQIKISPLKTVRLDVEENNQVDLSFYRAGEKAYAAYTFSQQNTNRHLKLIEPYLTGKFAEISPQRLEDILNVFRQE
ncbi:MAG: Gldg family protein [Alphaproteobacteria bacterium]|nr:Gldg family protein [Alphaproteobacteria bacterium]